ncbi:hypothetical protein [Methylocaldum sp. BRCS4]|uniref:hypothetical protein n=1 Tax=Methylocaldum sp. GT1TLB TaxID=3438965 RepID=UPI0012EB89E2|nr:hypothetical protein [Methylocaldum sp. BRCS4]
MTIYWYKKNELADSVRHRIATVSTVLDIGCGIRPQTYTNPLVHICCDPFEQYVDYLEKWTETEMVGIFLPVKAGWKEIAEQVPPKSVDTVFLLDVIEHLEKEEGSRLLRLTEKIARRQVIIFTPLGFLPQEHSGAKDAWGLDGADYQAHRSGWLPDLDFDETWEIHASREFHYIDNNGNPFDKPYGAFWAIKTLPFDDSSKEESSALYDVNSILISLGEAPIPTEKLLSVALNRCRSAAVKYNEAALEKERSISEYSRVLAELDTAWKQASETKVELENELYKTKEHLSQITAEAQSLLQAYNKLTRDCERVKALAIYRIWRKILTYPGFVKIAKGLSSLLWFKVNK